MTNHDEATDDQANPARVARLFEVAGGEDEAIRALDGCVAQLHEVQQAKTALTGLSAAEVRAALEFRRATLRDELA